MELGVFKPLDWKTASIEIYEDDEIVAEVFARDGDQRRLYVSEAANKRGVDWSALCELMPRIRELLDQADTERQVVQTTPDEL